MNINSGKNSGDKGVLLRKLLCAEDAFLLFKEAYPPFGGMLHFAGPQTGLRDDLCQEAEKGEIQWGIYKM
ncbi:hypothetical protein [Syntrophomonas curvata]